MLDTDHFDHYSEAKKAAVKLADITDCIIDVYSDGSWCARGSFLADEKNSTGMAVVFTARP